MSNNNYHRQQPQSLEAEQAVLGCCMLSGSTEAVSTCLELKISEESFYHPKHQTIFEAMKSLVEAQMPVDEITLGEFLSKGGELEKIGGYAYINEVSSRIDTSAHLKHYIRILRDCQLLRGLLRVCHSGAEGIFTQHESVSHYISKVEQEIFKLSESSIDETTLKTGREMVQDASVKLMQLFSNKGEMIGVPSGFKDLDVVLRGFHAPQMIVIAARPGKGKTSMALNIAESVILGNGRPEKAVPTLMFSLEMGADELMLRLVCSHARVNSSKIMEGFATAEMQRSVNDSLKAFEGAPLLVDESMGLNILEMRAKARRLKKRHDIGLIIIDYLQLVNGTGSGNARHEDVAEISRNLKGMAKELQVPVVALAQLNRETEKDNRPPRMSDLRESGSIEQDADIILLIADRKGEENTGMNAEPRDLIIAKNRNGRTGVIPLTFVKSLTRFENAARDYS